MSKLSMVSAALAVATPNDSVTATSCAPLVTATGSRRRILPTDSH
jgi:hypothetical protein